MHIDRTVPSAPRNSRRALPTYKVRALILGARPVAHHVPSALEPDRRARLVRIIAIGLLVPAVLLIPAVPPPLSCWMESIP